MFFKVTKILSCFTFATILFYLGFSSNYFHAADAAWFKSFQYDSDSLVYGRMLESQKNGALSYYGLLGRVGNEAENIDKQKPMFLNDDIGDRAYYPYLSQVGLQGFLFSILDSTLIKLNLEPKMRIELFYAFSSIALSLVLSLLSLYFLLEFGIVSWMLLLITIISSQWLVVMGKSLYWSFWLMFAPLLIILWAHKIEVIKKRFYNAFYCLTAFFVFVKCCAGYEYISSVLISAVIPIVYYSLNYSWSIKATFIRFAKISISGLVGFFVALITHIFIVAKINHYGFSNAFVSVFQHSTSRMYADKGTFGSGGWEDGANASVIQVLSSYWRGEAFNLNNLMGWDFFNSISFGEIILTLIIFSSAALWSAKYSENIDRNRRKVLSFASMAWFSILSPLSWFILAKVHSYVHTHINHVLWSMPFILFVMAFVGYIIKLLIKDFGSRFGVSNNLGRIFLIIFISVVCLVFLVSRNKFHNDTSEIKTGVLISEAKEGNIKVYLGKDNSISYIINDCDKNDLDNAFFLHFYPLSEDGINGLTFGFENHDFMWNSGASGSTFYSRYVNVCYKTIKGPAFKIRKISTGQYINVRRLWQSDYQAP